MFLSTENYLDEFRRLLEHGSDVSLAVAFWGRGAEKLIETAWNGKTLRILFNLANGGTNPKVIRSLMALDMPGLELLIVDDLHAKVGINERAAIVGSANVSVNGLGLEGVECGGWKEAGVLIEGESQVAEVQKWFDALWHCGVIVTEDRLLNAQEQWDNNRANRPKFAKSFSKALEKGELHGRRVFIEIHRLDASEEAAEAASRAISAAKLKGMPELHNSQIDWYEDWPEDYSEPLPIGKAIISVYYSPTKGVSVNGAWERMPHLDTKFKNKENYTSKLVMVAKLAEVEGLTFRRADAVKLATRIRPWVKSLYAKEDSNIARCLPLDVFLEWEKGSRES